jgi:photosystem II stability/assembly factor-like uncharacterized protein
VHGTADGKSLWAVGDSGTILHTTDGETWKSQTSGTSGALISVNGTGDGKSLWVVGTGGTILHTTDGEKWEAQTDGHPNSLDSVYGTRDGKSLWAVGGRGTILHSTDGETWKAQTSGTLNFLRSVHGTADGKSLWAVGDRGTILHSTDGETWKAQTSGTPNDLYSVYGTGDGKSLWAVGWGTILHSTDGETWKAQASGIPRFLYSVFGTDDGTGVWVVGAGVADRFGRRRVGYGGLGDGDTILHSTDGQTWKAQTIDTSNVHDLLSVYGTGGGKSLWTVGAGGTILHSTDGETWKAQSSGTSRFLSSVFATDDGMGVWAVGAGILRTTDGETWNAQTSEASDILSSVYGTGDGTSVWAVGPAGTILHGSATGRHAFIQGALLERTQLVVNIACPDQRGELLNLKVTGRNWYKFKNDKPGFDVLVPKQPGICGSLNIPINIGDLEMGAGEVAYFNLLWTAGDDATVYHFDQRYDPWYWFRENEKPLSISAVVLGVITTFAVFLGVRPLWNLRIYQAVKLAQINDKLSTFPVLAPLQLLFKTFTILPWFVAHPRTLDAWVRSQSDLIEQKWGLETLPAKAGDSLLRTIESTSYIPLPLRIGDPQSGEVISQPSASTIGSLFSAKRTVIEVIGPGGAGKTTLARQFGKWALQGGRPGGFSRHAMIPVWIDEDVNEKDNSLASVVKGKLAALLPEEKLDDAFLGALLTKQRLLFVVDRLSERSAATQQYIGRIYRSTRAEALLITARTYQQVQGAAPVVLYPQPLNQKSLLHFMTSLVSQDVSGLTDPVANVALTVKEQLALGDKLATLYEASSSGDGKDAPILPLPVRLFVEEAKRLIRNGRTLDELPLSVPEVYSRYLEQVNPEEPAVPNFMTHAEMLRAALILAKLALSGDFIPKEFFPDEAAAKLREAGWTDPQKLDPVRRLLDNGILIEKGPLVSRRLRFVLDPIADSLAAVAHVRECKGDPACLDKLRADAAKAPGFLAAVDLACRTT